jgi:hypothetical protein
MTSRSTSSPGRSSESASPPPARLLPRKNSFNPFIAQVIAKTSAASPARARPRARSEKFDASSGSDSEAAARSVVNGTTCAPSGEFDEHGLSLAADVASAYHVERVARASTSALNAPSIASSLDPDTRKLSDARFLEVCMLGVPSEHRRSVWLASSGVDLHLLLHKQYYKELRERLRSYGDKAVPDSVRSQIDKDIVRTLCVNIRKDKASLTRKMRRVCLLYAMHNPDIAYSQGFNFMIMSLLILKFTVEEAFWMLDHINTRLFPITWDTRLTGLRADLVAFSYYCSKSFPDFSDFLTSLDLTIDKLLPFEAFATLLLQKMPHESAWCVWDRMFAGGAIEFFHALLHIMKHVIDKLPRKIVVDAPPPVVAKKARFFSRHKAVPEIDLTHITTSSSASPPRMQYDIDADNLVSFFSSEVRRIVDMPRILALKMPQQINPLALEMRRNRIRMQLLAEQASQNHDRLGSSSTDSS